MALTGTQSYKLNGRRIDSVESGIESVTVDGCTIKWVFKDGGTATMTFPEPEDGVSVTGVSINDNNHMIVSLSNGTTLDAGKIPTAQVTYDDTEVRGLISKNTTDIGTLQTDVVTATQIAKGRSTGYVFDTESDLDKALEDETFVAKLSQGDNLYIREVDVPDYWWDGENKCKQKLETQKVDLTEYTKTENLVSPDSDNTAELRSNGIYVPASSSYELPKASDTKLGGIKVGENLSISEDGTLSATSGGGGGTSDYVSLNNKPSINGVTLVNDLESEDLKLNEVFVGDSEPTDSNIKLWVDTTTNLPYSDVVVADFNDYSTDEIMIGRWIDGKPIYRKKLDDFVKTSKEQIIATISDAETIIKVYGVIDIGDGRHYPIPNTWGGNLIGFGFGKDTGTISVFSANWNGTLSYTFVEYTKTTDTADTFDANNLANVVARVEATDEEVSEIVD